MKGIIVSELELVIKKNDYNTSEVNQKISNINKSFNSLEKCFAGSELEFLTSKINLELQEFKNIIGKINAYQSTLQNVLKSYQLQNNELTNNLSKLTP